jgi:hypothetical protein
VKRKLCSVRMGGYENTWNQHFGIYSGERIAGIDYPHVGI